MLIRPIADGIEIDVRVSSGASRTCITGSYGERLTIRVCAAPERGQANRMVCETLADALNVPRSAVQIVKGHGSRDKIVQIRGVRPEALSRREET